MDLYTLKENQTIELKEASDRLPANLFETYSSFANTCGGVIYLGVREKAPRNIIVGVKNLPMLKKTFLILFITNQRFPSLWAEMRCGEK